ncbi:uncharacterized protein LOC135155525 [Lytechinus pictus]|uniref:uncharacterized protein LOC135155525 n=1 Tax=Lytechinus pictus TaxID=7653 RepID=UPI0030B9E2F0
MSIIDGIDSHRKVAYFFGDSQPRPVVQGSVRLPRGPVQVQLVFNSTSGGTCHHIDEELKYFKWRRNPDTVVVAAGTNNIGQSLRSACQELRELLRTSLSLSDRVVCVSIAPRLDRKGDLVQTYNTAFAAVCEEEGTTWFGVTGSFPTSEKKLWARD